MARMEYKRGAYRVLVGRYDRNRPLGRHKRRWEIILKFIFKKWDEGGINWIDLVQERDRWRAVVNAGMNLRVP